MRRLTTLTGVVGVVMALAAGCGGGSDSDDASPDGETETTEQAPRTTRPRPTAPAGTAPPAATTTELLDLLPKAGDIGPLQLGIPAVAAIRSMAVEVSQDPTGPCGAALDPLTLEGAAGRTYDTVKGRIVGIAVPRDAAVDAYIEANRGDLTDGCASHTTTTADGGTQTLSAPAIVDVSATAPDGIAWISTIEDPAGAGERTTLILPTDGVALIVTLNSPEAIDPALVQTMAEVWYGTATAA
jgi:hypothetical protein